jgi:hypothetical protein
VARRQVRDANGQALAYVYSRDSEAEALQAKETEDEARPLLDQMWMRITIALAA